MFLRNIALLTEWNAGSLSQIYLPYQHSKQDVSLHHHSVSYFFSLSAMASILHFLSPRAAKALDPVCTLTQSTSSMTISVKHDEDAFHQSPESPCSLGLNSNQRTRNQFRPRNTTKGTTGYQLRQYAEATLGGGSLRKTVKLPEGEDENEWLAVNSMEAHRFVHFAL